MAEITSTPETAGNGPAEQIAQLCFWVGLSGFSLGSFLWQVTHRTRLESLLLHNRVGTASQREILVWISSAVILLGLCVGSMLFVRYRKRPGSLATLDPLVHVLQASVALFLVPALFMKSTWASHPVLMMLLLSLWLLHLYSVAARSSVSEFLQAWSQKVEIPPVVWYVVLSLLVLAYIAYFSHYAILRHYQLQSRAYDLAVFENAFMQTLNGNFLNNAHYGDLSLFSRHFSPIYALWYPFYWLFPKTETLLAVQSAFVAASAVPLFFLARLLLRSNAAACLIAFFYLIHPGNHGPNFYDIHEMASFPVFVLAMFYFLERRRFVWYFVTLALALAVKEDIALLMLAVACFIAIGKRQYKLALTTCLVSVVWYIGAQEVIVRSGTGAESSGQYAYYYEQLIVGGAGGATAIVKTLLTNPFYSLTTVFRWEKLVFALQMCLPLLFLPLARWRYLLLSVYGAGITLLATRPFLFQIGFQYTWYSLPLLFVAAVYVLAEIKKSQGDAAGWRPRLDHRLVLATMLLASFVLSWQYGAVFHRRGFVGGFDVVNFNFDETERQRLRALRSIVSEIPRTASVAGSETLVPHVPVMDQRVLFRETRFKADYLVIFSHEYPYLKQELPWHAKNYAVIKRSHDFLLLKKQQRMRPVDRDLGQEEQ